MMRANGGLLPIALVAALGSACGGNSSSKRSVAGQLKVSSTTRVRTKTGAIAIPSAGDLLSVQLTNRPRLRAQHSLPFARALAKKFQPLNNKLVTPRPASGTAAIDRPDAFAADVAVFAYDDANGVYVDAQYLNTATGEFDLNVVDNSPISIWTGTYDMAAGSGTVVMPISYGFDYDLPPATTSVSFDYDPYFYVSPADASFDAAYVPVVNDQSGYYEFAFSGGTAYLYLLADDPSVGSYYMIWDDGTCSQGTQVYVAFDSTGNYFTVNGVDGAFSLSGVSDSAGYFSGTNIRWDVVGDNGQTYEDLVTVTFLDNASTGPSCPTGALVDPCAATGACALSCPAGCSLDQNFGICTVNGTYDPSTGTGVSCELDDLSQSLIICPAGCAEPVPADGFCYVGGNTAAAICY